MPYIPTVWTTGVTALSATVGTNFESQYTEATNSFEQDLFTPFVFSGLVATKDGTTASQLDVTAGVAFVKQTDGTLRRRAPTSSTQSTVGHPSATMYLDLNPDGSWSWNTAHSGVANYLPIASVTTDAGANIATVTDARVLATTLLSGMAGGITFPGAVTAANFTTGGFLLFGATVSGGQSQLFYNSGLNTTTLNAPQAGGAAKGIGFGTWDGAATHIPFSIGGQFLGAASWVDNSGRFHDSAGLVVVEGANNTVTPLKISGGTALPGTLGSREIFILLA